MKNAANKNLRKVLSGIICLALVMSYVPMMSLNAFAADAIGYLDAIRYLDANGNEKFITDYNLVDSDTTSMSNGWYVLKKEVAVTSTITITGNVHLILCDYGSLSAPGVNVSSGNSLTIYAQSRDPGTMGSLTSNSTTTAQAGIGGYRGPNGTLVINGGKITASIGKDNSAAIGGGSTSNYDTRYTCGSVTINGGIVTATGAYNGSGIGGGARGTGGVVTVTGGIVFATGGTNASAIGGGREGNGGTFIQTGGVVVAKVGNMNLSPVGICFGQGAGATGAGKVTCSGGITFTDGAGVLNGSAYTLDQPFNLPANTTLTVESGKTLTVAESGHITVSGALVNKGTIVNNGGILNQGTFTNSGSGSCGLYAKDHPVVKGKDSCAFCGTAAVPKLYGGVYYVSEDSHMYWLAEQINAGNITGTVNIELVDDITLSADRPWTPIALPDGQVCILNGNGNTLTIEQSSETESNSNYGLFSSLNYSTIKNLVLKGSITCNTTASVGAIAGSSYRTTYENIVSFVTVTNTCATAGNVGGIAGYYGGKHDTSNGRYSKMVNCAVYADITGFYAGGLVGCSWNSTQYYDITGGLYVGDVTSTSADGAAGAIVGYQATDSNTCTFTNVFWNETDGLGFYGKRDTGNQVYNNTSAKTAEEFASGELAWLLNNGVTDGSQVWYQNLDEDDYPLLAGPTVYYGYNHICTATERIYSNVSQYLQDTPADHFYSADCDTICNFCGAVREASVEHVLKYQSDGSQHWQYCSVCKKNWNYGEHSMTYEDNNNGGHYYICENCRYIEKFVGHDLQYRDLGDGTHRLLCIVCGYIHANFEIEDHILVGTDMGDGTHIISCSTCDYTEQDGKLHSMSYTDLDNGTHKCYCNICNYVGENVAHTVSNIDNGDGTHTPKCEWCDFAQKAVEHVFVNKGCWNVCVCGSATENYDSHSFDTDGFCTKCENGYQKPTVDPGEDLEEDWDDTYLISNAGQLYWYARQLNENNLEIHVKLTADIVIPENAPDWTPINSSYAYFDGNFKTISGLKCIDTEAAYVGLFGNEGWWYEISNLHITNSYFEGNNYVGAVVANLGNGGSVTNCYVTNTTVKGDGNVGTLVGCLGLGHVINCYVDTDTLVGGGNGEIKNSYYLSDTDDGKGGKTAEQFASGEVAYLLQSGIVGEEYWDEDLGEWVTGAPKQIWGQDSNQAGAKPMFTSNELYKVVTVGETGNYSVANVGDTNADGTVDVIDYQALVNTVLADEHEQIETASYDDIVRFDLDGDGCLDVIDASIMHLLINGFTTIDVYAVGDYDLNGVAFEEGDVLAMAEAMENPEDLATYQKYACDLNADGKVTEADLTALTSMFPLYFVDEK